MSETSHTSQLFQEHAPRSKKRHWYWLTPAIALTLFMFLMGSTLWWLDNRDDELRYAAFIRDVDNSQERIKQRMFLARDRLSALARELPINKMNELRFIDESRAILYEHPEILHIIWLRPDNTVYSYQVSGDDTQRFFQYDETVTQPQLQQAIEEAKHQHRSVYSAPYRGQEHGGYFSLVVPMFSDPHYVGTLLAIYSTEHMLNTMLPTDFQNRYKISLLDGELQPLAASSNEFTRKASFKDYSVLLDPPNNGMLLHAYAFRTPTNTSQAMLMWIVVALSAIIIWSLIVLWRHMRFRSQAEDALINETAFRRAMENSMLTGMRVLDMNGRITYINPAFCRMIGWDEQDIIGRVPPYPYWPLEQYAEQQKLMDIVLSGNTPSSGLEMDAIRHDGSRLTVRLYVSPLINQRGIQTGWMTSMTDITEPTRIRKDLNTSHERFMTVLEGIEDAISVTADNAQGAELLFTNETYRTLFGAQATGHDELVGGRLGRFTDEATEIYSASVQRWFEVRHRTLLWVDGRRARMQIARDITERRASEDASITQQEKIQLTSRLITMGEMASSLAHELNQPLTAIANYCMGAVAKLKMGASNEDVLPALEKTTQQAQRAGMIIRRIREFVKRSEPKRQETRIEQIIDNAVGFADIEARKRNITIETSLPDHLPAILADPIMIEQVLLNLIKNGLEAMQDASEKTLNIDVELDDHWLSVHVVDRGHGLRGVDPSALFEPFFSTKSEGMGMGLNICRTIIEFHHGRLWAEDNAANGTTFTFTLPWDKHTSQRLMTPEENDDN